MNSKDFREIPYNYTSADDKTIINIIFGPKMWEALHNLRHKRVTGRSARLLFRMIGDLFIFFRNPFLYQELITDIKRRRKLFRDIGNDLEILRGGAEADPEVKEVLDIFSNRIKKFRKEIFASAAFQRKLKSALGSIIGRENVNFEPFDLVSHSTDATDWRLFTPLAVCTPSNKDKIAPLLKKIADLGLHALPRGAGTGLTGGAVPLSGKCVMINTEKLCGIEKIRKEKFRQSDGTVMTVHTVKAESGAVTDTVINYCRKEDLVFATDPTSSWACTIGGNISENAGGKAAVRWGTAIDNILSYSMALSSGRTIKITRQNHPLKKIQPEDTVTFKIDEEGRKSSFISLKGSDVRKNGLWKDITNKYLGGLPGLQKEGTDGVILDGEFVLYPAYSERRTLCLEFFGPDMDEAGRVINEICSAFPTGTQEALTAMEHFDDQYIKAIGYKVKSSRGRLPKAVLLIDISGHNPEQTKRGVQLCVDILGKHKNT
ncbi:MAG: DUF3683 domain-containing protein [Fibrobacterota bacterium]